jgi:phytoene dehydrogenase-like protein
MGAELAEHGLRYVQGSVSTGASFPDGRAAVIQTDPGAFCEELGRLGERQAWSQSMADVSPQLNALLALLGMDLASPEAAALLDTSARRHPIRLAFRHFAHRVRL